MRMQTQKRQTPSLERLLIWLSSSLLALTMVADVCAYSSENNENEAIPETAKSGWRFEVRTGRGYEENVIPAPPEPPPPPAGPPPPGPLPLPPPPTSPGDSAYSRTIVSTGYRYHGKTLTQGDVHLKLSSRLQAMLTRYDKFSDSNMDEIMFDISPALNYDNNESRFGAQYKKTNIGGTEFQQEYMVQFLQMRTLTPQFDLGIGADLKEQRFAIDELSRVEDHRRNRLIGNLTFRLPRHSRVSLLVGAGSDIGLKDRDDYDVWGGEFFLEYGAPRDRLRLMARAEYEHGDSRQSPGSSREFRKVEAHADFRVRKPFLLGIGYKIEDHEGGILELPTNHQFEALISMEF